MKKLFRWILAFIIAVVVATWAIYDEISVNRIVSLFEHITGSEIVGLIVFTILFRLLIALISYLPRAVDKQRMQVPVRNVSEVDAELDFLNSLMEEEKTAQAPRPTSCAACGASLADTGTHCVYCNTAIPH